jgi:hypothetical protein
MLPGFRFLFAAILLSTSILVFGLGAAALLRASHEQYVSNPSWRNGPKEKVFAQAPEPAQPMLAVLRTEPEAAEPDVAGPELSLRDQIPTIGLPVSEPEQVAAVAIEADAQREAAAPPAEVAVVEPAKPAEATMEVAAAPADTLTPADATAAIPEVKPAEPLPAALDAALASSALDVASAKLPALNNPAATSVKDAPAKAQADSKATKPKAKAKAKRRQRVVRRPPPQQLQQQLDPFGQQTFATTPTRTR